MKNGKRPTHELAMHRFLSGKCPLCGKGKGDPKGIEERTSMAGVKDLYCHSCRRPWTNKTVLDLKHELPVNGNGARHPSELAVTVPSPSFFRLLLRSFAALVGK